MKVREAELSMLRRVGASKDRLFAVQSNLAIMYGVLGRMEDALRIERDVYLGFLKLKGEHRDTLLAASNCAASLLHLQRFEEARRLMRKTLPVARRVLGSDLATLRMRRTYAEALYKDDGATLDDLREAVTTLEETEITARRVFGGGHPTVYLIVQSLPEARAALHARETPSTT